MVVVTERPGQRTRIGPNDCLRVPGRKGAWVAGLAYLALVAVCSGQITITEFPTRPNSQPNAITSGPDGNLWFTYGAKGSCAGCGAYIGQITPSGTITEFPLPGDYADRITSGPDGNLWFTEVLGNQIGRITPSRGGHRVPNSDRSRRHHQRAGREPVVHGFPEQPDRTDYHLRGRHGASDSDAEQRPAASPAGRTGTCGLRSFRRGKAKTARSAGSLPREW